MSAARLHALHHSDRLSIALVAAICAHALVILGVHFEAPKNSAPAEKARNLEILIMRPTEKPRAPEAPPDYLAPKSADGGGQVAEAPPPPKLETPPPLPEPSAHPAEVAEPLPLPLEPPRQKPAREPTVVEKKPPPQKQQPVRKVISTQAPSRQKVRPPARLTASQLMSNTRLEAAKISAQLDRNTEIYAKRLRRKHISASTQEYVYATYLEAWRRKIERIGNLNYPEEAKKQKLYGHLVMTVTLFPDGSISRIGVIRSSGQQLLDDAAVRIVKLAAPFAPFPEEIRRETDLLEITRTWQFLSSNRLFAGD